MTEKEIIKACIKSRSITQSMLAEQADMKGQTNVARLLHAKSMSVDSFIRMLNAMGFDLIVKDRNGANKENVWKVERDISNEVDE